MGKKGKQAFQMTCVKSQQHNSSAILSPPQNGIRNEALNFTLNNTNYVLTLVCFKVLRLIVRQ